MTHRYISDIDVKFLIHKDVEVLRVNGHASGAYDFITDSIFHRCIELLLNIGDACLNIFRVNLHLKLIRLMSLSTLSEVFEPVSVPVYDFIQRVNLLHTVRKNLSI